MKYAYLENERKQRNNCYPEVDFLLPVMFYERILMYV